MQGDDTFRAEVARRIADVETEMRRAGVWQSEPLPPDALEFREPWGHDRLSFEQWLQFVLVPRVHEILRGEGEFPPSSVVAAQAVREFDGNTDAEPLLGVLSRFDDLFNSRAAASDAAAAPGADGDEFTSELDSAGAAATVHAFVSALRRGDDDVARARLTRPARTLASFVPRAPFRVRGFTMLDVTSRAGCIVVRTHLDGVAADGTPAAETVSFAVIHEDGDWRVDLGRTTGSFAAGIAPAHDGPTRPHGGRA